MSVLRSPFGENVNVNKIPKYGFVPGINAHILSDWRDFQSCPALKEETQTVNDPALRRNGYVNLCLISDWRALGIWSASWSKMSFLWSSVTSLWADFWKSLGSHSKKPSIRHIRLLPSPGDIYHGQGIHRLPIVYPSEHLILGWPDL
jgi:hypothetical protein